MESVSRAPASRHAAAWRSLLWACLLLASLLGVQEAGAQNVERTTELKVKAAYLYKFASFVEWPEGAFARADSPVVIGVIGADALADELERTVIGQVVNNRPIIVRRLRRADPVAGLHILFAGALEKGVLQDILHAAKGQPSLTVTDSEDAYAQGSMLNFVVSGHKLRFDVALKPVALSGLKISARMLSAANKVTPG